MGLFSNFTTKAAVITSVIVTAIVVSLIAYAIETIVVNNLTKKHEKALAAQKTALVNDCNSDKSLTQGTDNAIYLNHASIDSALNDRLFNYTGPRCLAITGDTGGPTTPDPAQGNVHKADGQGNGVSRAELYRIAAEADKILSDLHECRGFLENTWKAKGQIHETPR